MPDAKAECNYPTNDAGKNCTDSTQCESYCEAPKEAENGEKVVGKCYGFEFAKCIKEARNDTVGPEWCY